MKKLIALACAVVLAAGMTLTAVAAPSVESKIKIDKATDANGADVSGKVVIEPIKEGDEEQEQFNDLSTAEKLKIVMGSSYEEGMSILREKRVYAIGDVNFPLTITFSSTLFAGTSKIVVLHYDKEMRQWEVVGTSENGSSVTATFNTLSPVAFIAKAASTDGSGSTDGNKAPGTGDAAYMWMFGTLMVAALGVAVVSKRKAA